MRAGNPTMVDRQPGADQIAQEPALAAAAASVYIDPAATASTHEQAVPFLHTDDYPFTSELIDRKTEDRLDRGPYAVGVTADVPQMDTATHKQLNLTQEMADGLKTWDLECARKHLNAIKGSVTTHEALQDFTLMEGEHIVSALNLACLGDAPGLYQHLTQQCRLGFTSKNRLIFTQTKHSAEVGRTQVFFLECFLKCFHDRWSRRTWSSYYASINASEILQCFVQETLSTSYQTSACTFIDCLEMACCPRGGTLYSEKDVHGATQTLGDHDPDRCISRWDKTRFLRHSLVIRYVDCATNSVKQTIAMAEPGTPAAKLYMMARYIDANITMKTADWIKSKTLPTPLVPWVFIGQEDSPPLVKRTSYLLLLIALFILALIWFAVNVISATFMLLSVVSSLLGSLVGSKRRRKVISSEDTKKLFSGVSKAMIGTQSASVLTYAISVIAGISRRG